MEKNGRLGAKILPYWETGAETKWIGAITKSYWLLYSLTYTKISDVALLMVLRRVSRWSVKYQRKQFILRGKNNGK